MKSKTLNILLCIAFIITVMAPLTGVMVHKLASVLFLLLCVIHTCVYRKQMNGKRWAVLGIVLVAFCSGILGMIYEEIPIIIAFHKAISIVSVFILAIHIFVFHKRMKVERK